MESKVIHVHVCLPVFLILKIILLMPKNLEIILIVGCVIPHPPSCIMYYITFGN